MIRGLKPVSRRWPKVLRNVIRGDRFWNYGWRSFGLAWEGGKKADFAVRRSNRVYNFVVNRHRTGRLFDSSCPKD